MIKQWMKRGMIGLGMATLGFSGFASDGGDWPMWGRTADRNMISMAKGIPAELKPGEYKEGTEMVDMSTTENVLWVAKMGSQSYGNPTVAGGKVFIGTNNESPRDPKYKGDRGVVMAFDEKTGAFEWQLIIPKLGSGKVNDWEYLGVCSSPAVADGRVYVVTNRCEVVALDINGMKDGNQGFQDEAKYKAGPDGEAVELGPKDADILWIYDMREELGVFPHNVASSSVLITEKYIYATTSNGQDWSHVNIPSPNAPSLIALDRKTGKLAGEEASGISKRLYHCNWSSPTMGKVDGQEVLFFGAGDGYLYGFDPEPVKDEDGYDILRELFRVDANPPEYKTKDGKPIKYPRYDGPSELIATPVLYNDMVYVVTGQDPEHGTGVGALSAVNPKGAKGDATKTHVAWRYKKIERSISTPAIKDDIVYAPDFTGFLHAVDAKTGKEHWIYDTESNIWASPLVVDGKVYLGNEDGILTVMQAGKEKKVLQKIEFPAPLYSSPIVANGVLYIGTQTHLYAIKAGAKPVASAP
jgi:outer membrane protein assembly factor BamB